MEEDQKQGKRSPERRAAEPGQGPAAGAAPAYPRRQLSRGQVWKAGPGRPDVESEREQASVDN